MISFRRTRDLEVVRSIMTHEQLWPWLSDDFAPAPENFQPNDAECLWYMLAFEGELPLGLFITHPINQLVWEVDHALLPWAWGAPAREAGAAFEAWLFSNTPAIKAVGFTPACNKLALRYARQAGMREVGRITRGYQRRFELFDIVIFEKEKGG
jgi:hypothetical protein